MAREFKGARHGLNKELANELVQFCKATDRVPGKVIVRAVREYLDAHKDEAAASDREKGEP